MTISTTSILGWINASVIGSRTSALQVAFFKVYPKSSFSL